METNKQKSRKIHNRNGRMKRKKRGILFGFLLPGKSTSPLLEKRQKKQFLFFAACKWKESLNKHKHSFWHLSHYHTPNLHFCQHCFLPFYFFWTSKHWPPSPCLPFMSTQHQLTLFMRWMSFNLLVFLPHFCSHQIGKLQNFFFVGLILERVLIACPFNTFSSLFYTPTKTNFFLCYLSFSPQGPGLQEFATTIIAYWINFSSFFSFFSINFQLFCLFCFGQTSISCWRKKT